MNIIVLFDLGRLGVDGYVRVIVLKRVILSQIVVLIVHSNNNTVKFNKLVVFPKNKLFSKITISHIT
jgi:hypothetical protein